MFTSERQAITNIIATGVTSVHTDRQGEKVINLIDPEEVGNMLSSYWSSAWTWFTQFGAFTSGILGIFMLCKIVKFMIDTIIHVFDLYPLYGYSWKLIGAFWDAITQCLINKHHRNEINKQAKENSINENQYTICITQDNEKITQPKDNDDLQLYNKVVPQSNELQRDNNKLYPSIYVNVE